MSNIVKSNVIPNYRSWSQRPSNGLNQPLLHMHNRLTILYNKTILINPLTYILNIHAQHTHQMKTTDQLTDDRNQGQHYFGIMICLS